MRTVATIALTAVLCVGSACDTLKKKETPPARAEFRQVTRDTFQVVPTEGQFPYCLIFTRSETGVIRQMTMTHGNRSVPCEPGKPIGGVRYRVPVNEGQVKIHVFFSDQTLNAGSIAQDLYERKGDPSFRPIDLRLPGNVHVQTFEFRPQPPMEETTGVQIGAGGQIVPPSAGAGSASSPGTGGGSPDAGAGAAMHESAPAMTDAGTR